jgi:hypothetical protein
MMEEGYTANGWLGLLMGSKLWYPSMTVDAMRSNLPKIIKALCAQGIAPAPPVAARSTVTLNSASKVEAWAKKLELSSHSEFQQVMKQNDLDGLALASMAELANGNLPFMMQALQDGGVKSLGDRFKIVAGLGKLQL